MGRRWNFYTTKEIKPAGWLKTQLQLQAKGLSGNLDKVWRDIRDSQWIGGDAEGWERVPYWLDGFIPLAYLLEDEDMIARAKTYVDAILSFQKPDGWICPCEEEKRPTYDTWAVLLISKVLTVYYDCSGDERMPGVIYRVLRNYYELLEAGTIALFKWGKYRWFEGFIAIDFLYEHYKEDWIRRLADILYRQGKNYDEVMDQWKRPINKWTLDTHIVNLAMMLKSEAVSCDFFGRKYTDQAEKYYKVLKKYNGTPVELFTGDECLSGLSPIQGTELCAIVEQMYSYEWLYAYTGDAKWAERLEVIAFNALPATISDDMWTHQYVQMSNQISCERFPGRSLFRTNNNEAHLFGLEPHYGCCTANFNQGWPKLALSAFMWKDDTIVNAVPVPAQLNTKIGEAHVRISLETNYPFENRFVYQISADQPAAFTLKVRIPSFAKHVETAFRADGSIRCDDGDKKKADSGQLKKEPEQLSFRITDCAQATITVSYETVPVLEDRPHHLKTAKCGSLVYSLPITYEKIMYEYEKNGVERKFPYCDYEYKKTSDWEYGFADAVLEKTQSAAVPAQDGYVFSSQYPPVALKASVKKINWGLEDGFYSVCAKKPVSYKGIGEKKEVLLYPYGCAKLRMTELPLLKNKRPEGEE